MQDKVISKREMNRKYHYKGKAPFKSDRIIAWWCKLFLQLLIFSIIYTIFISGIRTQYNNFFIEFAFVFFWLISSDFLAHIIALVIKIIYNYKKDYLPSDTKKTKNYNRKGIEYLFYTTIRCFSYLCGLTPALTAFFYSLMPFLWGFFAYLLAWLIIYLGSKLIAWGLSVLITKSVV